MSKAKGLHTFTVQEAQNATMGQAGTAFVDSGQGTDTYTPPTGTVVVAIKLSMILHLQLIQHQKMETMLVQQQLELVLMVMI